MTIHVEAWRRPRETEELLKVTEASFTFVALEAESGRPRLIPPELA
jgi:acyl-CoA thioesterase YciA